MKFCAYSDNITICYPMRTYSAYKIGSFLKFASNEFWDIPRE